MGALSCPQSALRVPKHLGESQASKSHSHQPSLPTRFSSPWFLGKSHRLSGPLPSPSLPALPLRPHSVSVWLPEPRGGVWGIWALQGSGSQPEPGVAQSAIPQGSLAFQLGVTRSGTSGAQKSWHTGILSFRHHSKDQNIMNEARDPTEFMEFKVQ